MFVKVKSAAERLIREYGNCPIGQGGKFEHFKATDSNILHRTVIIETLDFNYNAGSAVGGNKQEEFCFKLF